jgi:hypothetical protein
MSGQTLTEWHRNTYGKRPALFMARRKSWCCWCGGLVSDGDEACYWPEYDATVAHADCLRVVWKSHA